MVDVDSDIEDQGLDGGNVAVYSWWKSLLSSFHRGQMASKRRRPRIVTQGGGVALRQFL
jgi:hypothetical protein